MHEHLDALGLRGNQDQLIYRDKRVDRLGYNLVRYSQVHRGVPVLFGEVRVQYAPDDRAVTMLVSNIDPDISVVATPSVDPDSAVAIARTHYASQLGSPVDDLSSGVPARLVIYSEELFARAARDHLVWTFDLALKTKGAARKFMIDAHNGEIVAETPLEYDLNRQVEAHGDPGSLRLEITGPSSDARVNAVWPMLGDIYAHFLNVHGWNSYDDADGAIKVTVKHPALAFNASYSPYTDEMTFGFGMDEMDVVAHEFTHAVTRYTANLWYVNMSGALSESISDVWGAVLGGNWLIGETTIAGTIRDMANPPSLGPLAITGRPYPDHLSKYECMWSDNGGVHINSSIINKAAYNLWIGTGLDGDKTSEVFFRSLESCLLPTATFTQMRDCATIMGNQVGIGTQTVAAFTSVGLNPLATNPSCIASSCLFALYVPVPNPVIDSGQDVIYDDPSFADLAYRLRDDVFTQSPMGDRYTNMYYANADALEATIASNPGLFADGASLIAQATPGLMGMLGFTAQEPVVTQQFVDDTAAFFQDVANLTTDTNLAATINLELFYLSGLDTLVGKTYAQAWAVYPHTAWIDPFCCIGP